MGQSVNDLETTDHLIQNAIEDLLFFDGEYKKDSVNVLLEHPEQSAPKLLALLEDILANPYEYSANEDAWGHVYAVMLLGYWRNQAVHPLLIDLFGLPDDLPDQLFGEMVTENLPALLCRTQPGSLDLIKSLIMNSEAYEYCRGAAVEALCFAALEGVIDRESVLSYCASLFKTDCADPYSQVWNSLACCMLDLYPERYMDTIELGFTSGQIDPRYVGMRSFEETLARGKEATLEASKKNLFSRDLHEDFHRNLEWWACFHEEEERAPRKSPLLDFGIVKKNKNVLKRERRKARRKKKKKR